MLALGAPVALLFCLHGCLSVPEFAARGSVAGYPLSGPVDSEVAKDYVEGRPLPSKLEDTRHRLLARGRAASRGELTELSRRYSPDVATLLFLETVSAIPTNRTMRERFESELAHVRRVGVERAKPDVPDDLLVLLVPGWFYWTNGAETNADYRIQRRLYEQWGIRHALVRVGENGTVDDNARIVADAIRQARGKRVFVVSASKSGAEVALALGRDLDQQDTEHVVGWLSIGGVVRGSPLADRVLEPDICWVVELKLGTQGFDLRGLKSMQTAPSRDAFETLHLPRHIRVVSYVPVPLSGNISERGSFGYHRMRDFGPNDGLTLLADELVPGATTILAPGLDHFLGAPDTQNVWSTAMFRAILTDLAETATR